MLLSIIFSLFPLLISRKTKAPKIEIDRFEQDIQREKQKQKKLEREMKKQRVRQLKMANEEEDKIISRLEKQLKIDKSTSSKRVPKMFNDGLEYALELCLPESIENMYKAAKEAAKFEEEDSDSGFQEDIALATKKNSAKMNGSNKKSKRTIEEPVENPVPAKISKTETNHMVQLRKAESKYFDIEDELDSDFGSDDSEIERDDDDDVDEDDAVEEVPIDKSANGRKSQFNNASDSDEDDFEDSEESDFSEDENSSNESEENESQNLSGQFVRAPANDDESMDDSFDDFDSSAEAETSAKPSKNKDEPWEDIYGRSRDKDGNVILVSDFFFFL